MSLDADKGKAFLKTFSRTKPVQVSVPFDDDLYPLLLTEYGIIHLLYHRNLNQHHVARWWSHLDILHRHVRKILLLMEDIDEIRTLRRLSSIQWNASKKAFVKVNEFPQMVQKRVVKKVTTSFNNNSSSKKYKKKKVEKFIMLHKKMSDATAVNVIGKKISLILKEAKYLHKSIIPASFWVFMGVIELAQFVNIGFTLIGFISRIWCLLQKIDGINLNAKFQQKLKLGKKKAEELKKEPLEVNSVAEMDIGEVIDVSSLEKSVSKDKISASPPSVSVNITPVPPETEEHKSEPPKRKSADVMDDLFGSTDEKKVKKQKKDKKDKKNKKKKARSAIDDIFGF